MPNGRRQKNGQPKGSARGGVCCSRGAVSDIRAGIMPAQVEAVVGVLATCYRLTSRYFDIAVSDLRMQVCDATLIADVSNQKWFVQFITFCNFAARFTIVPQLIASRTTIMNVVPAIYQHMVHMVRDGLRTRGERQGVEEDPEVAARIMACSGPIVLACGDGKNDKGKNGVIFRAVRSHLEAGRVMIIMAKKGTCSGNYTELEKEFPLLRVVDLLVPE